MKYVRILREEKPMWGVLQGDTVRTLAGPPYEGVCYDGGTLPLNCCTLLAPCEPSKIVCVGKNYRAHAHEMGGEAPDHPILFLKAPNTLNHPEREIHAPSFVQRLDYEGELAMVVRRRAKDVKAEDFFSYILGFTCLNDITARDVQALDGQWTRAKSMDGFAPTGPLVTDEVDGSDLAICTRVNGIVVQTGRTNDFITSLGELFAFITAAMTLEPGDVIATGTPAGIGPMTPGDAVEVEIEGIGVLRNRVV